MSLRGNLKDFGISEIIQLLSLSHKTGVLTIITEEEGHIYFKNGECYFASSTKYRKPIGQRLIETGLISKSHLVEALKEQKKGSGSKRLGRVLLDQGLVESESLEIFVTEQIWDAFLDILSWKEGEFAFDVGEVLIDEDINITLETWNKVAASVPSFENVLKSEQWGRIKQAIPSLEIVFALKRERTGDAGGVSLAPNEWALVCLIDGKRSVAEIMRENNQDNFQIGHTLHKLLKAGLIAQTGVKKPQRAPDHPRKDKRPIQRSFPEAKQRESRRERGERVTADDRAEREKVILHQAARPGSAPKNNKNSKPHMRLSRNDISKPVSVAEKSRPAQQNNKPNQNISNGQKPSWEVAHTKKDKSSLPGGNEIKAKAKNKKIDEENKRRNDQNIISTDSVEIKQLGNLEVWTGKEKRFADLFIIKKGDRTSNVLRFPDGKYQFVHNRFSPEEKKVILEKIALIKK